LLCSFLYFHCICDFVEKGPAPESVTSEIYRQSCEVSEYKICQGVEVDFSQVGEKRFNIDRKQFVVKVVDSVQDYVKLMREIFDLKMLSDYVKNENIKLVANGMNGGKITLCVWGG